MIKRDIDRENIGVAGFFLDIPVFMIIIISLSLFFLAFANNYSAYNEAIDEQERYKNTVDLHRQVMIYRNIRDDETSRAGHFCIEKLDDIEEEQVLEDITTEGRYDYSITIDIHDDHDGEWEFKTEEAPERKLEINYFSTPVTIIERDEGEEKRYIGKLLVILWET